MALQRINGHEFPPLAIPVLPRVSRFIGFTSVLLDASGEKIAYPGFFWNKDGATKSVTKVHFSTRAVTFNSGSVLTVSLQNRSATGAPVRPDETVDQSGTITGTALTANTYHSVTLDSPRSVTFGEALCVVFEITTFNASDAVNIGASAHADADRWHLPSVVQKTGGSWGATNALPNVVLECDDGTFGTIAGSFAFTASTTVTAYASGSSPNEYAIRIIPPVDMAVDGVWGQISLIGTSSTADWILYDSGTTPLTNGTISLTQADVIGISEVRYGLWKFSSELDLDAGSTYYLAFKATSSGGNTVQFNYYDVQAAGHMDVHSGGQDSYLFSRAGGSWTGTTTRRPLFGLTISKLDDGAGGGGSTTLLYRGANTLLRM